MTQKSGNFNSTALYKTKFGSKSDNKKWFKLYKIWVTFCNHDPPGCLKYTLNQSKNKRSKIKDAFTDYIIDIAHYVGIGHAHVVRSWMLNYT